MLKQIAASFVVAVAVLAPAAPACAAGFLQAIEDVPLADGLSEADEAVVFESEQGRVVQTTASGSVDAGAISRFYQASLPALGWRPVASGGGLAFARENETLGITIRKAAGETSVAVRFELIVKLASTRLPE